MVRDRSRQSKSRSAQTPRRKNTPDPNNIQGIVTKPDGPNTPAADKVPETVDYIVQPGDSLSLIAQRFYGSSRHAQFIYESNRDVLRSIDALNIGQTLKLPPLDP